MTRNHLTIFSEEDIKKHQPEMKVGLLATVTPEGLPHVTMLSTVMACGPPRYAWPVHRGNVEEAHPPESKNRLPDDEPGSEPVARQGHYTHSARNGREIRLLQQRPLFRYKRLLWRPYGLLPDLIRTTGRSPLPMNRIIFASVQTMLARMLGGKPGRIPVNQSLDARLPGQDGQPEIPRLRWPGRLPADHPGHPARAWTPSTCFLTSVYTEELMAIPAGVPLAVFSMALTMEDVLLRGTYQGIRGGGFKAGVVEVDWVYNPMPRSRVRSIRPRDPGGHPVLRTKNNSDPGESEQDAEMCPAFSMPKAMARESDIPPAQWDQLSDEKMAVDFREAFDAHRLSQVMDPSARDHARHADDAFRDLVGHGQQIHPVDRKVKTKAPMSVAGTPTSQMINRRGSSRSACRRRHAARPDEDRIRSPQPQAGSRRRAGSFPR